MTKQFVFLILFLTCHQAWSQLVGPSAYRKPGVTYKNYTRPNIFIGAEPSAEAAAGRWNKLDLSKMEAWGNFQDIEEAFEKVRDHRFLSTLDRPQFLRRSTWLYPRDGCFARAGLAVKNMMDWKFPKAYKVFVFGDLTVNTENYPLGQVTWWYHVVPAVKFGTDIYILDPAIDPQKPLLLKRWLETMTTDLSEVKVAVCDRNAYAPYDACNSLTESSQQDWGQADQEEFLYLEWANLKNLKRDPEKELGDFPPWSVSPTPSAAPGLLSIAF